MSGASASGPTVGEALVQLLEERGVDVVFGIPGVHTIELYRGLAPSTIRHVTPRHEQGAGFMADGYSRATGRIGVAFVITGPGVTNILTPMAQALADSIPMLVVSGVNESRHLGQGRGHLHELPDQQALCAGVSVRSVHVDQPDQLEPALDALFERLASGRPGPVHLQVPLDVFGLPHPARSAAPSDRGDRLRTSLSLPDAMIEQARDHLNAAERPVIIAGGGAIDAERELRAVAEALDAPVVQTINARSLLFGHPLGVPASPDLPSVRTLIESADVVLAVGTELGPTDFDVYNTGTLPTLSGLIRIDIDQEQLDRHRAVVPLRGHSNDVLARLLPGLRSRSTDGTERAADAQAASRNELPGGYDALVGIVEALRDACPDAVFVGDSTQLLYAANMRYAHDRWRGWFNSSVGYGALGYAIPAAIGAAVGLPGQRVVALTGDGGAQFTLAELMVAVEEALPIAFVVWNNHGYQEIADAMRNDGIPVVGCDPRPPDFEQLAAACGMAYVRPSAEAEPMAAMLREWTGTGPLMMEVRP